MGSLVEINDTLKISKERGFPKGLSIDSYRRSPERAVAFVGKKFKFWNKDERLYNRPPTRVFLVEETSGKKWLYWGHAMVVEQRITKGKTEGVFQIVKLYSPEYQKLATIEESPKGKSWF